MRATKETKKRFGENIGKAYFKSGKTVRELSKECKTSTATLWKWMSGDNIPNAIALGTFCKVTGTDINDIYEGVLDEF